MILSSNKSFSRQINLLYLVILLLGCVPKIQPEISTEAASTAVKQVMLQLSETASPTSTLFPITPSSTVTRTRIPLSSQSTPTPSFTPTPFRGKSYTSTPLPPPTAIYPPPFPGEWLTYTHPSGVSLRYPGDWEVYPIRDTRTYTYFYYPSKEYAQTGFVFYVLDRPVEERSETDPHNWPPNEGGYELLWAKPMETKGATGWEFVYGPRYVEGREWNEYLGLYVYYYSPEYELDIRLESDVDIETRHQILLRGFEDAIHERYGVFEAIARSIRIEQP